MTARAVTGDPEWDEIVRQSRTCICKAGEYACLERECPACGPIMAVDPTSYCFREPEIGL